MIGQERQVQLQCILGLKNPYTFYNPQLALFQNDIYEFISSPDDIISGVLTVSVIYQCYSLISNLNTYSDYFKMFFGYITFPHMIFDISQSVIFAPYQYLTIEVFCCAKRDIFLIERCFKPPKISPPANFLKTDELYEKLYGLKNQRPSFVGSQKISSLLTPLFEPEDLFVTVINIW